MKQKEGIVYTEAHLGMLVVPKSYSVKRLRYGWCVEETRTGQLIVVGIKDRLRANYVVAMLTGKVHNYYEFGGIL